MTATLRTLLVRLGGTLLVAAALLASRPAAAQWVAQTSGLPQTWGVSFISIADANNVWAVAFNGKLDVNSVTNTYLRTTNGGTTWKAGTIADAFGLTMTNVSAASSTVAWVSCNDNTYGGGRLYYTADGGTTWTRQLSTGFAGPDGYLNGVLAFSTTQAVALGDPAPGANFEIYTTTNAGTTWKAAATPARLDATELGFARIVATVPGTDPAARSCWMGTTSGRVLRSTDSGVTWAVAPTGLKSVSALTFCDANNGLAFDESGSSTSGMLVATTDGGATWKPLVTSGPQYVYNTSLAGVPGRPRTFVSAGYDADFNVGSAYSTDGGATWTAIDTQLHYTLAFLNATTGYSGGFVGFPAGFGGMYRGSLPAAALATTTARPLAGLVVYPNPASDYFTVAIPAVASASRAQATLYNALGQVVARQEASLLATGQQLSFPTAGLAGGLYTLRVQAGEQVASQPVSVR